ncbi:MAG: hypothetical protein KJO38_05920, partial [Gammaproteobacteria bacterium]|nr:hypothetical protein [Gammaproteobacteria bacterium]
MISALTLSLCLAVFLSVRLWPTWQQRHQGCDAWYFLLCGEIFRRERKVPVVIPGYYMLELDEQWYPPLFMVFCGVLPQRWLERGHWAVTHITDAVLVACAAFVMSPRYGLLSAAALTLAYGPAGAIVMEFRGLTSRALAVAELVAFMMLTYWYVDTGSLLALAAASVAMVVVLYTHKLSTQLVWFLLPLLALSGQTWA